MKNLIRTAVIIEDEPLSRDYLDILLKQNFAEEIEVKGYAGNISEAIKTIETVRPDIVFMDIKVTDGTAFDILEKINYKSFHLIFVTAYEEFALRAFKYSALDYLLKPVDIEDLQNTIQRITNLSRSSIIQEQIDVLKNNMASKSKGKAKVILPTQKEIFVVLIPEIIRAEANNTYTTFYISDGRTIMVSKQINYYEEILAPFNFFRAHQSHLINLDHVSHYSKTGIIQLKDKTEIPVALRRREQFITWLNNHS